jgi:hypothetical protein
VAWLSQFHAACHSEVRRSLDEPCGGHAAGTTPWPRCGVRDCYIRTDYVYMRASSQCCLRSFEVVLGRGHGSGFFTDSLSKTELLARFGAHPGEDQDSGGQAAQRRGVRHRTVEVHVTTKGHEVQAGRTAATVADGVMASLPVPPNCDRPAWRDRHHAGASHAAVGVRGPLRSVDHRTCRCAAVTRSAHTTRIRVPVPHCSSKDNIEFRN